MADTTEIAWTDSTHNPWIGCTKVGPGCDNCYAEREFDHRHHRAEWGPGKPRVRTSAANWKKPLQWNAKPFYECPGCGWRGDKPTMGYPGSVVERLASCPNCDMVGIVNARRRVFCASLADVFDNEVSPSWRFDLFELIAKTPNIDWLLLTKRIGNVSKMLADVFEKHGRYVAPGQHEYMKPPEFDVWPWPNVWIGATICNQTEADRDIPKLLAVPAAVRFISMEPLLGAVNLEYPGTLWPDGPRQCCSGDECGCRGQPIDPPLIYGINWVIVGGESGPKARPMHPQWVRDIRDQCAAASVPFLFKQHGEWAPRSACYHTFEDGKSLADMDPGATDWPCILLNEDGSDGRQLVSGGGGDAAYMQRVGKKAAGRLLDGKLHNEFPGEAP